MYTLFADTETFCDIPINYGAHRYAEAVEVMVFAFAVNDGPRMVWDLTSKSGDTPLWKFEIEKLLSGADRIVFHNSAFDRAVIESALGIKIPVEKVRDTMVQARTLGLPGALDTLCDILKIPADKAKSKKGKDLIQLFCKSRPANSQLRRATRETHPKEWTDFLEYAGLDIEAMRAIYNKLPTWNYSDRELTLWQLDQKINDRGVRIDTELAAAALRTIERTKRKLDAGTSDATLGCVDSATRRDQLLRFILGAYGVELPDMQSATLERRINDPDLPQGLRDLLAIRLQTCTTSTAKYRTLLNGVNTDGRLRGTLEFCGAGRTGRWSGRKFQPHNLPSRNLMEPEDIERGIILLKRDAAELVYDNMMWLTSSCLRGAIIPTDDHNLFTSDLANIEGRDAAWLAGEEWKIKAFEEFDKGVGYDLYKLSYAKAFNIRPEDVTKHQRQIGKVMELMLQYEGGVGAFLTGAAGYGIDLDAMADVAWENIPQRIVSKSQATWRRRKQEEKDKKVAPGTLTFQLSERTYIVCDALKLMWREAHPAISSYWEELKQGVIRAIENPGKDILCRKLILRRDAAWLRIILPSGRSLCYGAPLVEDGKISYMGVNQYTRKWGRISTYGGKIFENVCQAVARDVMAHNMPEIELHGYRILFSVHDEVVTEAPANDDFSAEDLSRILARNPPWAIDMPLAAGGFRSNRYRKD